MIDGCTIYKLAYRLLRLSSKFISRVKKSLNIKLPSVNTNLTGLERAVCQQTGNSQQKKYKQSVETELSIGSYCWLHVLAF